VNSQIAAADFKYMVIG